MIRNDSETFNSSMDEKNHNYYMMRSLAKTVFFLSIPALMLRFSSRYLLRSIYYVFSAYYVGHSLRKINDELIEYGKNSFSKYNWNFYENNNIGGIYIVHIYKFGIIMNYRDIANLFIN